MIITAYSGKRKVIFGMVLMTKKMLHATNWKSSNSLMENRKDPNREWERESGVQMRSLNIGEANLSISKFISQKIGHC